MSSKYLILLLAAIYSLTVQSQTRDLPNVILIMADDMGHECLGSYGSTYQTPVLDSLAANGIRFTNAISQPLCTPSRVKLMTGLRNYQNYTHFGYLGRDQRTIGHLMKDAGYTTLVAGKWQLNGLSQKMPDAGDNTLPHHFGFDEYSLWQLTKPRTKTAERYANPLIEKNGKVLDQDPDQYGPDLFVEHVLDFIERKKDQSFFVYYPMVLVHDPFVPTPDSKNWEDPELRYKADTAYFREMVTYADKIVGKIVRKVNELGLDNTLIIFTGDNGTHPTVFTPTDHGIIRGDKGQPTDGGTKVPLIANWPGHIQPDRVTDGLVEFTDFFATLAELTGREEQTDGVSFLNVLEGKSDTDRATVTVYYDPHWGRFEKAVFVRDKRYKLYRDGRFYDLDQDRLEAHPLTEKEWSKEAETSYKILAKAIESVPE
jgi:arylsulfatase A